MTDRHPERLLREVGARLDVPPSPPADELTAAVLARLDELPARRCPVLAPRLAAAAVALLAALGVAMAASPQVRAAVLEFLRIGGVEVHHAPPPTAPAATDPALPGERSVDLDRARARAAFPIRLPTLLGHPDEVRLADGDPPRVVSLRYDGIRVDQFEGGLAPMFRKFASAQDVVTVRVDGRPGVWVPRPHPVLHLGRDGRVHEEAARLSGSTLIWERDGLTYRVEGELTRERAVAIGESMGG